METDFAYRHCREAPGPNPHGVAGVCHSGAVRRTYSMKRVATVLVTGSCGLVGSEVSRFFGSRGFQVHGIDSNHRAIFFGPEGDTSWVLDRLRCEIPGYQHRAVDIRQRDELLAFIDELCPDLIIH